ncbi:MAG TPA: LysM peptidoglycan-binding domain-containing protein [Anaerolineales bacterium]
MSRIPQSIRLFTSIILVLAVFASVLPQPALAAPAAVGCAKNYTVLSGDTLSKIAFNNNVAVADLAAANNLKDPFVLQVGQVLCIPGTAAATTSTSSTSSSSSASNKPSVTAATEATRITITINNFPGKTTYYLRIKDSFPRVYDWRRLGRVRTNKDGSTQATFQMPKEMRILDSISICLKNVVSDDVICKTVSITPTAGKVPAGRR